MPFLPQRSNPIGRKGLHCLLHVVAAPALFVLIATATWPLTSNGHPDLGLYQRALERVLDRQVPYRDFRFEYPPFALAPCLAPILFGGAGDNSASFRRGFLIMNAVCLAVIAWTVRRIAGQIPGQGILKGWVLTLGAGILAPFLAWRYDLFPAMLTSLAFAAAVGFRPAVSGAWLGLAVSAKLYPLVLLPVFALTFLRNAGWRSATFMGCAALLALGATFLPFLANGWPGLWNMVAFHGKRGLHLESIGGGLVLLSSLIGGGRTALGVSYGAWHIHTPAADALASLHGVFFPTIFAIFLLISWQSLKVVSSKSIDPRHLARLSLAALLVFIVGNKVLSPQYLAWLLPFVPFLRLSQAILFLAVCSATIIIFPAAYDSLLREEAWAVVNLNLRNGGVILLLLWLLRDLTHENVPTNPSRPGDGI